MRLPIIIGFGVCLVMAAISSIPGGFRIEDILRNFATYSLVVTGAILLLGSSGPKLIKELLSRSTGAGRVRPNRSKHNELGSGDMAGKEHLNQWLTPTDEDDTILAVDDIVGTGRIAAKDNKFYIPGEERNRHLLFIAKTGSGKTTKAILPILYSDCMSKHRSSIVIDSKPEMWEKLAGMTAELNPEKKIMLFNPLDTMRSLSWNIVSKVEDDTDAKLIANTLIMATDNPASKSDSPFFRNNALQLLNAIMVGLLNDNDEVLSIPRIHELMHSGKNSLCDWLEVHPAAIRNAKTFVELARSGSQNADTILSELGMRLAAWDLKAIRSTTFAEELDLQTIIDHPTLFILEFRESEMEMLRPMANVVVIEILRFLTKAAEKYPGHKLPRPVGLVIDEFASALGRLPDIHVKLNTLRSRNVSICAAIQSIAQVKANYDKDADSVLAGFSTKILMPMLDFQDAEWASKETGTMTVRFKVNNTGTNRRVVDPFAHNSRGSQEQVQQRAVLTPDEIGRPIDNCATFFMPNTPVFQGHLIPFYKDNTMVKAIGCGEKDFKVREAPIEYEEILPDKEVLIAEQQARAAAAAAGAAAGGAGGQAIGAIQPATKVVRKEPTAEEVQEQLNELKSKLGWEETTGVAKEWWEAFEAQNEDKTHLVVALGNEILKRDATITEFFLAYLYSNTDSIEGNLEYLEKMKAEDKAAKENNTSETEGNVSNFSTEVEDQTHLVEDTNAAETNTEYTFEESAEELAEAIGIDYNQETESTESETVTENEEELPLEIETEVTTNEAPVETLEVANNEAVADEITGDEVASAEVTSDEVTDKATDSEEIHQQEPTIKSKTDILEEALQSSTIKDYINVAASMLERNTLNPKSVNSIVELAKGELSQLVDSDEELTDKLISHLKTEMLGVYLNS